MTQNSRGGMYAPQKDLEGAEAHFNQPAKIVLRYSGHAMPHLGNVDKFSSCHTQA